MAESANLAKGTFLATLSHEFRTPLNGMLRVRRHPRLDGPLTAEQGRKVERIKAGGWHLAAMIDEILSFAALEAGQERVHPRRLDARDVAREAQGLVEPPPRPRGWPSSWTCPTSRWRWRRTAARRGRCW